MSFHQEVPDTSGELIVEGPEIIFLHSVKFSAMLRAGFLAPSLLKILVGPLVFGASEMKCLKSSLSARRNVTQFQVAKWANRRALNQKKMSRISLSKSYMENDTHNRKFGNQHWWIQKFGNVVFSPFKHIEMY